MVESAPRTQASPRWTLLTLPPEMRNRIYREVLVEDDGEIHIADILPIEPGILRTCQLVRKEAQAIWYQENVFAFHIFDLDASKHIEWCKSSSIRTTSKFSFHVEECRNWPNLLVWLRAFYYQECVGLGPEVSDEGEYTAARMFGVIRTLTGCKVSWDAVEAVLSDMRGALSAENSEWALD